MKKAVTLAIIVSFASAAFVWWYLQPVQVNDAAANPGAYKGKVTLTGIASAFSPQDRTIFGLSDTRELERSVPNPRKEFIPVRYNGGQLPDYGEKVRVKGTFVRAQGGYLFIAEKIKVVNKGRL